MNVKPKRGWFQFSLRTVLLVITFAAVGCALLGYRLQQSHEQRRAVEALRNIGGHVYYEHEARYDSRTQYIPMWLRSALGDDFFFSVVWVHLEGPQVTDTTIAPVARLADLELFNLTNEEDESECLVTDDGIACVRSLRKLRFLCMRKSKVTDVGLQHLRALQRLQSLDVRDTVVTEQGCRDLKESLPNLCIER
jgi:hypothetical protein